MAGARATLGIVRGGTGTDVSGSERSERWGRAQRDGSGRPAHSPDGVGRRGEGHLRKHVMELRMRLAGDERFSYICRNNL